MKGNVSDPIIALAVDVQPMRQIEHVATPSKQLIATLVQQNNCIVHNGPVVLLHVPVGVVEWRGAPDPSAPMENRDVAIWINGNRWYLSEF